MIEAVKEEAAAWEQACRQLAAERRENEPPWLTQQREAAFDRFQAAGLPTTRDESWRYTDLRPVRETPFVRPAAAGAPEDPNPFASLGETQLVFVNGRLVSERTDGLAAGVTVQSLQSALRGDLAEVVRNHLGTCTARQEHILADLNLALSEDGAVVHVPGRTVVEEPIQLTFWNLPQPEAWMSHPRVLLVVEEGAQVSVVESHLAAGGGSRYLTNAVTEIIAADGAVVDHYKIQQEGPEAFHLGTVEIEQGRSTNVRNTMLTLGGALIRNETGTRLNGEGGWCDLEGLYVATGEQHVDNFTRLEHAQPHCDSRERYKGILDDRARGVFRGRIVVAKGAQKTDSKQTNNNLLLSDNARINTKPQLEIYADDVKCTHGATIGQLEAEAIFYLRSRGIDEAAARSLLTYAFANEVAERVRIEKLRNQLEEYLFNWLPRGELVREAV